MQIITLYNQFSHHHFMATTGPHSWLQNTQQSSNILCNRYWSLKLENIITRGKLLIDLAAKLLPQNYSELLIYSSKKSPYHNIFISQQHIIPKQSPISDCRVAYCLLRHIMAHIHHQLVWHQPTPHQILNNHHQSKHHPNPLNGSV